MGKIGTLTSCKIISPLNRLSQNLSQLTVHRWIPQPQAKFVKNPFTGDFGADSDYFFLSNVQRTDRLTDFDAYWLKMQGITQGFAF